MIMKNKRGQGVMGIPFNIIFSIIIIIFILAAAFIAIRWFFDFGTTSQIGVFLTDFQGQVDNAWNSQSADYNFNSSLPSGVEYICFVNFTASVSGADPVETKIYNDQKFTGIDWNKINFLIYSSTKDFGGLERNQIKHISLPTSNPYCIKVENGKVSIKLSKNFDEPLVSVS